MVEEQELLKISEATKRAGVCRRTIYNWMKNKKVEYIRTAGGSVRIYASSLWKRGDS